MAVSTAPPRPRTEPRADAAAAGPHPAQRLLDPAPLGHRGEIQALRALAVILVIAFHASPSAVPGGYIGVDVFFAISGLLITTGLLREATWTRTVSLRQFWARRLRRLLPAALLVLGVTAAVVYLAVPPARWAQFLDELRASVLYVENWQLASQSVDYFAASETPSPLRHFWSLSVEEQFYVLWPIVLLGGLVLAQARVTSRRRAVVAVLSVATALSFAYAMWRVSVDPVVAYFSTPARAWEFGAGALLALAGARAGANVVPWVRGVVSWAGLAAVLGAAFLYSEATPFPGIPALLPIAGALAVMWAGLPSARWSPAAIMRLRPVQWVGDASYGLYLWHWPLLILLPIVAEVPPSTGTALIAVAITFFAAWATKILVEDPIRFGALTRRPPRWTFLAAAAGMVLLLVMAWFGGVLRERRLQADAQRSRAVLASGPKCFGAAARDPKRPCANPALAGKVVPTPLEARAQQNQPCELVDRGRWLRVCRFGAGGDGPATVALVGDSHASAWRAALEPVARARGWRAVSLSFTGCPYSFAERNLPEPALGRCQIFRTEAFAWMASHPEITTVISVSLAGGTGVVTAPGQTPLQAAEEGYLKAWAALGDNVKRIMVIRDNPTSGSGTPDCVQQAIDAGDDAGQTCAKPRAEVLVPDPAVQAARSGRDPRARVVDLTDRFCTAERCYPVIGSALVHRDQDHLTTEFARTLAPALDERLPPIFR